MVGDVRTDDDGHLPRTPVTRERGEPARVRGTAAIFTALQESADRSPVAMAVVEGPAHVIRYANPAFRLLTGTEGVRVLGTPFGELMPPAAAGVIDLLGRVREQQCAQAEAEFAGTVPHSRDATGWYVTVWPVAAARGEGDADHLVVQLRDDASALHHARRGHEPMLAQLREINERLVLASLREQALRDEAQAASAAKSAFLATMSHEFRTPLTAIMLYGELLSEGITGPVTEAQRVQLARIRSCSDHLLALIEDVLTLSRLEAKKEVLRLSVVRIADVLDMTMALIAPMAAAKGLAFTLEPAPSRAEAPSLTVHTDGLKVRQILLNLLGNAVKYTDRGGITLTVHERTDVVAFEVHDTGIGIPPEYLEHIFDDFWQVRQAGARMVEGAGLGLSVSRRLAHLLGGSIRADSVVGHGSTFTFLLPRQSSALTDDEQRA